MQLYEYDLTMQSFYVSQIQIRYFFGFKLVKGWIFFSLDNCSLPVKALVSFLCFKFVVLRIDEGFNF